ncbi:MAG TPA: PEP-CTERM sorting domain-containing protein [Nitrosomonas nitrosa]|nr:PEP-CTERM sorting domain-containing protein [Nitrosomonas nitrosa]
MSAVPEAETWAMLVAGLGLIGWRLRKQPKAEWNMAAA